jgi:ubiquitin C-terminal hydrolase
MLEWNGTIGSVFRMYVVCTVRLLNFFFCYDLRHFNFLIIRNPYRDYEPCLVAGQFRIHINKANTMGSGGKMSYAYFGLVQDMMRNSGTFVAPVGFRDTLGELAPDFATSEQMDAVEFLVYVIDSLHEDLKSPKGGAGANPLAARQLPPIPGIDAPPIPPDDDDLTDMDVAQAARIAWERYLKRGNHSMLVDLFQGQIRSRLRCSVCSTRSVTYSAYSMLSVPLPVQSSAQTLSLESCISEFLRSEILDGDDAWRCSKCKVPRKSEKSTQLTRLPPVLIIHLKRFSFSGIFRNKLGNPITFPIRSLNLNELLGYPHTSDRYIYDLYAVVNHYGGLDGGHCTQNPNSYFYTVFLLDCFACW